MATYISNLTNGQIDKKGFLRLFGTLLTASGVIQSGSMAVSAQITADMTVKVAGAATGHDIVFITTAGDTYHGWNTTDFTVTITANSSGVIKTDAIVAYADLASGLATSNNPNALKFVAVRRSGTNTGAPTSGEIETAVSSNPYVVLSHATVSNGASSINSGNISDQRVRAVLGTNVVPTAAIQDGAVTTTKLADTSVTAAKIGTIAIYSKSLSLAHASLTSKTVTLASGVVSNGTYRIEVTMSLEGVPVGAKIINVEAWINAKGNNGVGGPAPAVAVDYSNTSVSLVCNASGNDTGFINQTNSTVNVEVMYIT